MDFELLAKAAGCRPEAVEDTVRRLEARFQGETPSPEAVQQWIEQTLRPAAAHLFPQTPTEPWDKLGMPREVWESLSPSTKLGIARQLQPQVQARPRRPERYTATPEQVQSVEGLSPAEKLTQYRQWREHGQSEEGHHA